MKALIITVAKIKTNFNIFTDAFLLVFATAVYAALNASLDFPLTQALLPNLQSSIADFQVALDNAKGLGKVLVEIKNNMRLELIAALRQTAYSVVAEANGSRALLLKSMFQLQKERGPASLVAPKGTFLVDGNVAGKLTFITEGGRNFRNITYKITADPMTESSLWTAIGSDKRKFTFEGLDSGKKYWAFVQIQGPNGAEYESSPISRFVQ